MKELYDIRPLKIVPEEYIRISNENILIEKKEKFIKELNKLIGVGVCVLCGRCKKELIGKTSVQDIKEKTITELTKTCSKNVIDKISNLIKSDSMSADVISYHGTPCLISSCASCSNGDFNKYRSNTLGSPYIHQIQSNSRRQSMALFSVLNAEALKKKSDKGLYYIECQLIIYAHHITCKNQSFSEGVDSLFAFKRWFVDLYYMGKEAGKLKREITTNFIKYFNFRKEKDCISINDFAVNEVLKFHNSDEFNKVVKYLYTNYDSAKSRVQSLKPKPSEVQFIDDFKKILNDYLSYISLFISESEKYVSLD